MPPFLLALYFLLYFDTILLFSPNTPTHNFDEISSQIHDSYIVKALSSPTNKKKVSRFIRRLALQKSIVTFALPTNKTGKMKNPRK